MSVSLNPFVERNPLGVRPDAGGVGISLPSRFAARTKVTSSPPSEFEGDPDMQDFMKDIANPNKLKNDSDTESSAGSSDVSADYDGDGNLYGSPSSSSSGSSDRRKSYYEETPSAGFLSVADEKADILFRLEVLRRQGIEPRKFSARDDVREMRAELTRIKTHLELDRSLKFSRKALVGLSAAIEFLNDKVDVLDLELDGFSDQMHQSVYQQKDYDSILEELYFKYRNKIQTPPEIRLLLTFGGAALTYHMSNVMAKKIKHMADTDNDGDFMGNIMKMFGGGNATAGPQIRQPEPARPPADQVAQATAFFNQQPPPQPIVRKEMAPPSFAFPNLEQSFQNLMPSQSHNIKQEPVNNFAPPRNDDESERLSDVPSDLESPPPSDFGSPTDKNKVIELTPAAPKKPRGRPRKNAVPAGRVIEI